MVSIFALFVDIENLIESHHFAVGAERKCFEEERR